MAVRRWPISPLKAHGHDPSAGFRGHKADIYEGGHRVPFLVRWPGHVRSGSSNAHLIGLMDVMATCAEVVGMTLPDEAGEDSVSFLPVLLGRAGGTTRKALVHHSVDGSFAIREGRWKLILSRAPAAGLSPSRARRCLDSSRRATL